MRRMITTFRRFSIASYLILSSFDASAGDAPCQTRQFEGQAFTVCSVDLASHDIRLFLKRTDGSIYGQPEALPRDRLLFAMNAGMFGTTRMPIGLYVEKGVRITALNTKNGGGNFHLQPNGVFWIKDGKAAVTTTASYAKAGPAPDFATQSGPMLVFDGAINPLFDANGPSHYVRNGVGIVDAAHVVFAISNEPVSFGVFAGLFRDDLKCPNALYLDGSVSHLFQAGQSDGYGGNDLGPLIGVYGRAP